MKSNTQHSTPTAFLLLSLFSAVLVGLVAISANPIAIMLIVGMFAGIFLLAKPKWVIWLILPLGLLVTGSLPLWAPSLARLSWGVALLGLLLFMSALFQHTTSFNNQSKSPVFVKLALSFFVFTFIITLLQWYSIGEFASAAKRYFQSWGLMLGLAWLVFDKFEIQRMQRFMLWVALLQLPFAVYERLVFVPLRQALAGSLPGLVPVDIIAGTFGGTITGGGNNAEMATFLIIAFTFLLSRWKEKQLATRKLIYLSIPILLPLFLGETKIVVILLPIIFLGLYGSQLLRKPIQGLTAILIGSLITVLAGYIYVELIIDKPLQTVIDETLRYNFYNYGYGNNILNRTSVISFWWQQNISDPLHFLFGSGLGSAQSGGSSLVDGHIAQHYLGYGIGLTAASQLLWETGLIGFILFALTIVYAWINAHRQLAQATDSITHADLVALRAVFPIFLIYLFYRNALLETLTFQIVFALLLGYLALLNKSAPKPMRSKILARVKQ